MGMRMEKAAMNVGYAAGILDGIDTTYVGYSLKDRLESAKEALRSAMEILREESEEIGFPEGRELYIVSSPELMLFGSIVPDYSHLSLENGLHCDDVILCDGRAISRTDFAALFERVGIFYGDGDGSTTFNIPDLRVQYVRGWDKGKK